MAAMHYQIISIDHPSCFDGQRIATPSGDVVELSALAQYRKLLDTHRTPPPDDLFLPFCSRHAELSRSYRELANHAHHAVQLGVVEFHDISAVGFDGLLVDRRLGLAFIGNMIGWSRDYLGWWIENSDVGFRRWVSDDCFEADFGATAAQFDDCIFMKTPGYNIYGHWLLDIVPRLHMLRHMRATDGANVVIPKITPWIETFLRQAGVQRHTLSPCETINLRRARLPTLNKNGFMLGEPITGLAWRQLAANFNHDNLHDRHRHQAFLYVSRRKWAEDSNAHHHVLMEDVFAELGFAIVHPEDHDLHTQAAMFAAARCIVGEDGSALHNIIFSQPGAVLGVINSRSRVNYWHAGICHLLGHRLAHIDASGEDDLIDLVDLRAFAVQLVQAVRR
jgi:hypothetical protein